MASTYVNNLRLEEIGTGEQSGTWGDTTNTNLELIGQAVAWGTRAIANASTDNITIADGAADADRCLGLKLTGGGQACTVTLLPNTSSKTWLMYNATAADLTFTCGSGANVVIQAGQTKVIATDGLGSGGVVHDLLTAVNLAGTTVVDDLTVSDDLTVGDDLAVTGLATIGETLAVTGIATFTDDIIIGDGKTIGSASTVGAITIASDGDTTFSADLNVGANFDVTGNAVIDGTALVTGVLTTTAATVFNGGFTSNADTNTFTSANASDPLVIIKNTANDASGARLSFQKDKGAAAADGDDIGTITFIGDNNAQEQTNYGSIVVEVSESQDTDEAGKMSFFVAESNGTTSQLTAGLIIEGEHATDGEVDVTIAAGNSSNTSVAGNLAITSDLTVTGVVNLRNGSASSPAIRATNDTNTGMYFPSADNLAFSTGGVQRAFLTATQLNVTGNAIFGGSAHTFAGSGVFSGAVDCTEITYDSFNDGAGNTGLNVVRYYSLDTDDATSLGSDFNNRHTNLYVNTTNGVSVVPMYGNGGSGVAWQVYIFDLDNQVFRNNQVDWTQSGSSGNTFQLIVNSGSGGATIQRTGGALAYQVYVSRVSGGTA